MTKAIILILGLLATSCFAATEYDVNLYPEENCNGTAGYTCASIPTNQCCGTDAEAYDSCDNSGGAYTIGGAPKGSDLTKLCAVVIGSGHPCFSVTTNTIVGCYWSSNAPLKRSVAGRLDPNSMSERDTPCHKPSHIFMMIDGLKYMLKTDTPQHEVYKNMTDGAERQAYIVEFADEVRKL